MRCSCHRCGTYMAQSEGLELGCVCPRCAYRCKACLGTDSVINPQALGDLVNDPVLMNDIFAGLDEAGEYADDDPYDDQSELSQWID